MNQITGSVQLYQLSIQIISERCLRCTWSFQHRNDAHVTEIFEDSGVFVYPLNAELNPICNLLVLLGDLTFMDTCIVSIFQYMSNKMQRYTVYLYLETPLHVSGGTSTHYQERIQLYLQHLVFVTPLMLSVLWVAYATHSTLKPLPTFTIAADSSNGVTNTRRCRYSCMRS
jgi:hypothetical protein